MRGWTEMSMSGVILHLGLSYIDNRWATFSSGVFWQCTRREHGLDSQLITQAAEPPSRRAAFIFPVSLTALGSTASGQWFLDVELVEELRLE